MSKVRAYKTKIGMAAIMAGLFVLGSAAGSLASSLIQPIKVHINPHVKVISSGKEIDLTEFRDRVRYDLDPIIYQGRTYLPVKYLSQSLNIAVNWDGANSTVMLGTRKVPVDLFAAGTLENRGVFDTNKPGVITKDRDLLTIHGQTYTSGFVDRGDFNGFKSYLDEKYQTVSFDIGMEGEGYYRVQVIDYLGRKILKRFYLTSSDGMKNVKVKVGPIKELQVYVSRERDGAYPAKYPEKVVITNFIGQ